MESVQQKPNGKDDVVVDVGKTRLSDLWKKEDYLAIWLGMIILVIGMFIYFPRPPADMKAQIEKNNTILKIEEAKAPFRTIAWHKALADKRKIRASNEPWAQELKKYLDAPYGWTFNPLESLYLSASSAKTKSDAGKAGYEAAKVKVDEALKIAMNLENQASIVEFKDNDLNLKTISAIKVWTQALDKASKAKKKANVEPYNRFLQLIVLGICLAVLFAAGNRVMGNSMAAFVKGFAVVFSISVLAYMAEMQQTMQLYGFGFPPMGNCVRYAYQ